MWAIELGVMVAMVAINSVFAGYEIALASVGMGRLELLSRERRRGAESALRMKRRMEGSLAVVQLGITLVGAVAAATGGAGAEESIEPWLLDLGLGRVSAQLAAIAIVVIPLTVVTIVLGELVPKVFALRNKEWVCLRVSPGMEWFSQVVWPAVHVLEQSVSLIMRWGEKRWRPGDVNRLSEDAAIQELRAVAALARTSRLIGAREEGIIVNAARLAATPVRNIMLPAEYISMLTLDAHLSEALIAAHHDMHTRFPVTRERGNPDAIVGYVNFKDIVSALRLSPHNPSLPGILRKIAECLADDSVSTALERLIREHHHIALVRDDDGRVVGLVTLEDILEELVGEIHDEYDRLPAHVAAAGEGWIVGGSLTLDRLRSMTGIELPPAGTPPAQSINDWTQARLGNPPRGGEIIHTGEHRIVVRKVRRNLVQEALIDESHSPPGVTRDLDE